MSQKINLIIFTNNTGLKKLFEAKETILEKLTFLDGFEINHFKIGEIFEIRIVKDDSSYARTLDIINGIEYNSEYTYLALHNGMLKDNNGLPKWKEKYSNAQIEAFSHNEPFYKTILPKIIDRSLSLDDLEAFFKTDLLKSLIDINKTWNMWDFDENLDFSPIIKKRDDTIDSLLT